MKGCGSSSAASRSTARIRARTSRCCTCRSRPIARARGSSRRCARRACTAARWIRCCRGTRIRSTSICARRTRCSRPAGSTRRSRCARTGSRVARRSWPHHTRILAAWRKDPRFVAWCYAREGYFRGDDARAVEGFGRIEPGDTVDLKIFLDALVALGREDEAPLAWAQFGLGRRPARCGRAARRGARVDRGRRAAPRHRGAVADPGDVRRIATRTPRSRARASRWRARRST